MKKMNLNRFFIALVCAGSIFFNSCGEDFLYIAPTGVLDEDALSTSQGAEMLIYACYNQLMNRGTNGSNWGANLNNWALGSIYGGDANKGSDITDQSTLNELELYVLLPTQGYINEKYTWIYFASKRVQIALNMLDKIKDMPEPTKDLRRAELYFLRAVFYFEGVKCFGPFIPYLDETVTDPNPKVYNDKDIWPNIYADIDKAIAGLPDKPAQLGRAYVWAAKMLKAKMLMQQGKLSEAKPILQDVLTNGKTASGLAYGLVDDLTDNWKCDMDNKSKESIFEIQYSNDGNNKGNMGMSLCFPHNGGPGGCCGFFQPSFDLVNSFQVDANGLPYLNEEYRDMPSVTILQPATGSVYLKDGNENDATKRILALTYEPDPTLPVDPRLDFAVGRNNFPYKDYGVAMNHWVREHINGGIFLPKKHVYSADEGKRGLGSSSMSDGWAPGSAMNVQYLSVRDAYLCLAECLADANDLTGAMGYVNKVRERAANPVNIIKHKDGTPAANYKVATYPATHAAFSDKATCIKAIRMERKLELAMEGHRWFDLARWGGQYMSDELYKYVTYEKKYIGKFASAARLSADRTMYPIPQGQIDAMGADENKVNYLQQPKAWGGTR